MTVAVGTYDLDRDLVAAVRADRRPRHRVYSYPGHAVVLGRGSDLAVEVDAEAAAAEGVPILRRAGGGCAVVLDPGNVVVSVVLPTEDLRDNKAWFDHITAWFIAGLSSLGVDDVYHDGISDLVRAGRKIAGSCIHRRVDSLYYSASLLVRPDLEQVARLLPHPPREPEYRRGRAHLDFMGSLADVTAAQDVGAFAAALEHALEPTAIPRPGGRGEGNPPASAR